MRWFNTVDQQYNGGGLVLKTKCKKDVIDNIWDVNGELENLIYRGAGYVSLPEACSF